MLSDPDNPDFRNSIKESILAVAAACKHLARSKKGTLNTALETLDKRKPLHPAFKEGLEKLYAWNGSGGGLVLRSPILSTVWYRGRVYGGPLDQVARLPTGVPVELGACLGIPGIR